MNESLLKTMLEWLKGQPFSNVIGFIQLAMIGAGIYYGVTVMVPEERKAILDGIMKQEEEQTKQIERVSISFEKALDRMSGRTTAGTDHGKAQ